jgi:hypothetical protein
VEGDKKLVLREGELTLPPSIATLCQFENWIYQSLYHLR